MARLDVIVKPGSKAPGMAIECDIVIVRVRERAVDGAANDACIRALAARLRTAPSAIQLVRGARSRRKLYAVDGLTTLQALDRIRQRLL